MPPDYRLFEAQITHPEHAEEILDTHRAFGRLVVLGLGALSGAGVAIEAVSGHPVETAVLSVTTLASIALGLSGVEQDTH